MSSIIPAIIPTSREHLLTSLEQVRFSPYVQIDVVDGLCASPASWPYSVKESVSDLGELFPAVEVMVDLMVVDPLESAREWLEVGADSIVVHLETVVDLEPIISLVLSYGAKIYIAGDDELPISSYEPWLNLVSGVQLMGIGEIGKQGQDFSPLVLENIRAIKNINPTLPVVIDGSVNKETLPLLVEAGANDFVVGSAIMSAPNKRSSYKELCDLLKSCNKQVKS